MRMAADRVAASLKRLDYAEAPVWEAAQQRLLARLQPAGGAAAEEEEGSASAGGEGKGEGETGGGQAAVAARLAAAVAAAAAAAPAVALEAEGLPFEERRPKVKSLCKLSWRHAGCCFSCGCLKASSPDPLPSPPS